MPIYDQGYRRYEARGPLRTVRFWPITREALRMLLARRAFLLLLLACFLPLVADVIRVYVVTRFPEAGRILPIDGRMFGEFLGWMWLPALFVSVFGGAGLVANDLRTGAILVYLSRPLTRRDYVLGKLCVLLGLNLSITLVPALLLYLVAIALAPEQFLKWDLAWIAPAVALHALVMSLVLSLVALAVSSLSKSARVAGLGFFGLLFGTEIIRGVLRALYDRPESSLLSLQADVRTLGNALFGIQERAFAVAWPYPALVLAAVALACLAVLRARVRAVEIVR
jgi:ABC-2 type transport system permease protein